VQQQGKLIARAAVILREIAGRFSIDSLAMYTLALASEVPVLILRATLVLVLASIALAATGHPIAQAATWIEVALIPTMWSILALATPFGTGWWWKQRSGGRRPSQREQLAYQDAIELLQAHTQQRLALPKSWFVLDTPTPDAAVCGETLMLSRGLLESEHLPAVLAHELGHLATPDGRLTAAIHRLVLLPPRPPSREQADYEQAGARPQVELAIHNQRILLTILGIRLFTWIVKKTLKFANGGFGLWLTGPLLGAYWRRREYKADAYAAALGQADDLADFLENHALIHDHPVPYIWLTEHTHPPVELRIDRLRDADRRDIAQAFRCRRRRDETAASRGA
jgi:Zn-dependent protease with chaperone function